MIMNLPSMKIIAVIHEKDKKPTSFTEQVILDDSIDKWVKEDIDYILDTTGNKEMMQHIFHHKKEKAIVIPKVVLQTIKPLLNERILQFKNLQLILDNIRDGLIVVNNEAKIQFLNETAAEIIGATKENSIGKHIKEVIKNSRLPKILQNQEKEVNQQFTLHNHKKIVTTRIPLINDQNRLVGAFAIFKDSNEVIKLAEENTDLKEIKTMLEAIIHSSDEAISVVDEKGNGLMINPAYTRITGLTEKEVIGQPATVDISEGESMHMKVLKTRRPMRGTKMKVGPHKRSEE